MNLHRCVEFLTVSQTKGGPIELELPVGSLSLTRGITAERLPALHQLVITYTLHIQLLFGANSFLGKKSPASGEKHDFYNPSGSVTFSPGWAKMLLRTSPEVVALGPRACDEEELSWCQLGDGHLSKDSPSGCQHVADVGHAHLKTKKKEREREAFEN